MSEPNPLARLLSANAEWAADTKSKHPDFFKKLAEKQEPKVGFEHLWLVDNVLIE
jgi:hypothetical protein